jgi:tripartite-type tricarboxylate transporter receptor subunit TctC
MKHLNLARIACAIALASVATFARADDPKYPTKPIQMVVPVPPGGPSDVTARTMEKLSKKYLGQPMVIVNKAGAGGVLGFNAVVDSRKDGYTIGLVATNMLLQPLYGNASYNYMEVMEPIAQAVFAPVVVGVPFDAPWKTLDDLIQDAKAHPDTIKYAYTNVGSLPHVVSGMFTLQTAVKMDAVPFQGGADSLTALLGKHVQVLFTQVTELRNHVKDQKVRILAVAADQRLPNFQDVPTFKEAKLDIVASSWFGVAAPRGIGAAEKDILAAGFKNIINDPDFRKTTEDMGYYFGYLPPTEMQQKWKDETKAYSEAVTKSGIAQELAKQAGK